MMMQPTFAPTFPGSKKTYQDTAAGVTNMYQLIENSEKIYQW